MQTTQEAQQALQPKPDRKKWLAFAAAMATVIVWASALPASRYALRAYSPEAIMPLRFLVACATLIAIGILKKIRLPQKEDIPLFIFGGFVGIFMYMWLFNTGTRTVVSGVTGFILASSPVFTLILSILILKEKVSLISWLGAGISFAGLIIVMMTQAEGFVPNLGAFILVLAAIVASGHNIIQRKILKRYTALEASTYCVIAATIFMLAFLPTLVREMPHAGLSVNLIVVYLGVSPTAMGYFLWGYALSKAEKTAYVAVFLYLIPFVSSIMAFFWLGETFSAWALLGGIVIVAGMVMTSYWGSKR